MQTLFEELCRLAEAGQSAPGLACDSSSPPSSTSAKAWSTSASSLALDDLIARTIARGWRSARPGVC